MKKAEQIMCIGLFALFLLLPVGTVLTAIFSYSFVLISGTGFAAATAGAAISAVIISALAGEGARGGAFGVLYALMAPLSLVSTAFYGFIYHSLWVIAFMLLSVSCSFYLSLRYAKTRGLKIASGICGGLLTLPVLFLCFMFLIFGNFGSERAVETLYSPDGKYYAQVMDYDQGALGGDTVVEVYRTGDIDLGIFKIIRGPRQVYFGEWREYENMLIYWREDNSLVVQGYTRFEG